MLTCPTAWRCVSTVTFRIYHGVGISLSFPAAARVPSIRRSLDACECALSTRSHLHVCLVCPPHAQTLIMPTLKMPLSVFDSPSAQFVCIYKTIPSLMLACPVAGNFRAALKFNRSQAHATGYHSRRGDRPNDGLLGGDLFCDQAY